MDRVVNARITDTRLGFERGTVLTFWLFLDYGVACQGFGGYVLNNKTPEGKRVPHAIAGYTIERILDVVEVESWEDLPGQFIRVKLEGQDWGPRIAAIGHILKEKWFNPEVEYAE